MANPSVVYGAGANMASKVPVNSKTPVGNQMRFGRVGQSSLMMLGANILFNAEGTKIPSTSISGMERVESAAPILVITDCKVVKANGKNEDCCDRIFLCCGR